MAGLSQDQLGVVAGWFASGASLDEIQKRIQGEFGVHLTYLDVRLMVADLPQPAEPEAAEGVKALKGSNGVSDSRGLDDPNGLNDSNGSNDLNGFNDPKGLDDSEDFDGRENFSGTGGPEDSDASAAEGDVPPMGELEVVVDPLAPPGCIACGSVTFGDGTVGKWMLDQMGRLGLSGLPEGYRPSPEDSAQFQPKLVAALRARGLV